MYYAKIWNLEGIIYWKLEVCDSSKTDESSHGGAQYEEQN